MPLVVVCVALVAWFTDATVMGAGVAMVLDGCVGGHMGGRKTEPSWSRTMCLRSCTRKLFKYGF